MEAHHETVAVPGNGSQGHSMLRNHDRLRRGFPQYFFEDIKMTKRQYMAAGETDPTCLRIVQKMTIPHGRYWSNISIQ